VNVSSLPLDGLVEPAAAEPDAEEASVDDAGVDEAVVGEDEAEADEAELELVELLPVEEAALWACANPPVSRRTEKTGAAAFRHNARLEP